MNPRGNSRIGSIIAVLGLALVALLILLVVGHSSHPNSSSANRPQDSSSAVQPNLHTELQTTVGIIDGTQQQAAKATAEDCLRKYGTFSAVNYVPTAQRVTGCVTTAFSDRLDLTDTSPSDSAQNRGLSIKLVVVTDQIGQTTPSLAVFRIQAQQVESDAVSQISNQTLWYEVDLIPQGSVWKVDDIKAVGA